MGLKNGVKYLEKMDWKESGEHPFNKQKMADIFLQG